MRAGSQHSDPRIVPRPGRMAPIWLALALAIASPHAMAQDTEATGMLMVRIQQLRSDVASAEARVADYRAAHPDLVTSANLEQQIALTLVQLAAIDSETERRTMALEALTTLSKTTITAETVSATGDTNLMMLVQARNALQAERSELAKTFRRAHPTMVALQARLNAAEAALSAAAVTSLQAASAGAERRAAERKELETTLAALQSTAAGSANGNAELAALERSVDTARLQLEMHLAQYMAPIAPPIAEEPLISVPPMPERPSANALQALILPVGIGVAAILALLLQGAFIKRRSYRKGFADGLRQAASESERVDEWRADETADHESIEGRQVA